MREKASEFLKELQETIARKIEELDGKAKFKIDNWQRKDPKHKDGGGGDTRVLSGGNIFEQAGVNFSRVEGTLPKEMTLQLTGQPNETQFFATGTSLVIHPESPIIPTTHANFRYLEVGIEENKKAWFGGGMDLTPYYFFKEDAVHFHKIIKKACDRHNADYYTKFKKWCDEYFYLPHRKEARGIGGCFFDYLGKDESPSNLIFFDKLFLFVKDIGNSFIDAYLPIVENRKTLPYSETEKEFQLVRRGRYVEFNLIYDRGTLFGLKTGGRTESILMSLPPRVKWAYNDTANYAEGTKEAELISILKKPRDWL